MPPGQTLPWLYTTARTCLANELRRRDRRERLDWRIRTEVLRGPDLAGPEPSARPGGPARPAEPAPLEDTGHRSRADGDAQAQPRLNRLLPRLPRDTVEAKLEGARHGGSTPGVMSGLAISVVQGVSDRPRSSSVKTVNQYLSAQEVSSWRSYRAGISPDSPGTGAQTSAWPG